MYLEFFGMSESPFPTVALSENYYGFQSMHQSLDTLKAAIQRDAGPCLVIGQAGSGKSILLDVLKKQQENQCQVICLSSTRLCTRRSLLQSLLYEVGQDYQIQDEGALRLQWSQFLRESSACQNGCLLLVDEAQTLPLHLLDELRVLTNLVRGGRPAVRLVLAGNSSLEENLNDPSMASFHQRIGCRVYLGNMGREELGHYINFQLERVDSQTRNLFTSDAIQAVHLATDGIPRLVNQLCEFALVCAAEKRVKQIDEDLVQWAWATMQQIPCAPLPSSEPKVPRTGDAPQATDGNIIEYGELDDDMGWESSVSPAVPDPMEPSAPVQENITGEIPETVAQELPESPAPLPHPVFEAEAPEPPAVITFAFEQDIQRPIHQHPGQIEQVAQQVARQHQIQDAEPASPVPPPSPSRPTPIDTQGFSQRVQDTLEVVDHALSSLDEDWETVEKVLAEADLDRVVRPVSSDPEQGFSALAGKQPTGIVDRIEPAKLFGDHLFNEVEKITDTDWGQFLQPLESDAPRSLDPVAMNSPDNDLLERERLIAETLADLDETVERALAQEDVDQREINTTSLPIHGNDDRRIIQQAINQDEIQIQHPAHTLPQAPAARRKDLRALLTALRGY